jgi:hypothetical protein
MYLQRTSCLAEKYQEYSLTADGAQPLGQRKKRLYAPSDSDQD